MKSLHFDLSEQTTHARTKGGEILAANTGVRLWTARVTLDSMTANELAMIRPLLDLLRVAGSSFLMWDRTRPAPSTDLTGAQLGSATPTIAEIPNPREIVLAGLPAGYTLSRDDLIGFRYGGRYALHQVVTGRAAGADGSTAAIEVVPPIRPGAEVGAAVSLKRAPVKAVLVPETLEREPTRGGNITDSLSFTAQQTLR